MYLLILIEHENIHIVLCYSNAINFMVNPNIRKFFNQTLMVLEGVP